MHYKSASVFTQKKKWLCAKKHNTHCVGVSRQAQRKSYMGTQKNDNLKI